MKGGIRCLALVLTFIAVAGSASAQEPPAGVGTGAAADSVVSAGTDGNGQLHSPGVAPLTSPQRITIGVPRYPLLPDSAAMQDSTPGGLKGYFFGTRKRASNTLLIGGVGVSLIGVGVVKGHAGAIIGVAGLLSAIAGMYLAF